MKTFIHNKVTFHVGTTADENWKLILSADPHYSWVHMASVPSAHVIIEVDDDPSPEELAHAARLCAEQTKTPCKSFVHTKIHNLRLAAKPGSVSFRKSQPTSFQLR
jgi:hypothetical protein